MRKVKKCTKCLKSKQLDKFSKNSRNKTDGRQPKCKECNKTYYLANQEKEIARSHKHYYKDHEASLKHRAELRKRPEAKKRKAQQDKAWRINNKEYCSEKHRAWARLNRARLNDYWKSWYHKNLEHARNQSRAGSHKRREWAIINGNNTLTPKQIEELLTRHPYCEYCKKVEVKLTVDHIIPLSRAGQNCIENVTIACESCNLSKGAKLLSEWILIRDSTESRPEQE